MLVEKISFKVPHLKKVGEVPVSSLNTPTLPRPAVFPLGTEEALPLWEPDWDSLGRLNAFGQLSPTASIVAPQRHCPHCRPESDTHKGKAFNWVYS